MAPPTLPPCRPSTRDVLKPPPVRRKPLVDRTFESERAPVSIVATPTALRNPSQRDSTTQTPSHPVPQCPSCPVLSAPLRSSLTNQGPASHVLLLEEGPALRVLESSNQNHRPALPVLGSKSRSCIACPPPPRILESGIRVPHCLSSKQGVRGSSDQIPAHPLQVSRELVNFLHSNRPPKIGPLFLYIATILPI